MKDSKAFSLALDTIFNKVAQKDAIIETREYQGITINEVKDSPEQFRVAYVITDEWFILSLGGGEVLEKILPRLGKGSDDGFFAQKNIAGLLSGMRDGQGSTSVTDIGATLTGLVNMVSGFARSTPEGADLPWDEITKLANLPLISVDKAWIDDKHMEYRARIAPKAE